MATTTDGGIVLSHATLCPSPLLIQKKTRRATFRRRILRKSTSIRNSEQYVFGPLDDIIDEIKSDIWDSPPDYSFDSSVLNWANPLKAPLTWTVTPLPVSCIPSDQPLMIRKNRDSRSSASGSSIGDAMAFSRKYSQEEPMNGGAVGSPYTTGPTPWPVLDTAALYEPTPAPNPPESTDSTEHPTAQQALENVIYNSEGRSEPKKRRTSRLRRFTNGFPRLRRTGTGETSASTGDASDTQLPTVATSLAAHEEDEQGQSFEGLSSDAGQAIVKTNARSSNKLGFIMERVAQRFPSPSGCQHDEADAPPESKTTDMPTTLRATVRVFPEVKILTEELQEIRIALEVEGVLHNRRPLPETTIDVIFVVDNGYYVTKGCLNKALDAANLALYYLDRGDRVALYTTHCTHNIVTGNRPELHYPIRPFSTDTEMIFQDLTAGIEKCGTQVWEPPRPNPVMADVILGIARSLEGQDLKAGRTHIILLSPAACVLHDVSTYFPDLYIHRINPAVLPYRRTPEPQDTMCTSYCCKNVFISNWASYQSVPGRIKRVLKYARSEKPIGELTNVSIDLRTRDGCELIKVCGSKDIQALRLGQVHTFFARIRVTRSKTQSVDLESADPVFNSCLDEKNLRQELHNVVAMGGIKVHLMDVQIYHRNSLHTAGCWNYTESPLLIIRELGGLSPPIDMVTEVYKRQYFHRFIRLTTTEAKAEAENLLLTPTDDNEYAKRLVERMTMELECHQRILEYEHNYRQKLPLCPRPVSVEAPSHDWLVDIWDKKKSKRKGVAMGKDDDITGLIDGIKGLERLG